MTYLTASEVKEIVHLCGKHLRLFLGNADAQKYQGEIRQAIVDFHQNPADFSDEVLLAKGSDVEKAHEFIVRMELRSPMELGAAQVSVRGFWLPWRSQICQAIRQEFKSDRVVIREAGSSSLEFNRKGVDKSLPIRYLDLHWQQILKRMEYVPGKSINSLDTKTIIASDGDGTLYEGPKTSGLTLLKDSPAYKPLMDYLAVGGVFMLISGNDLNRNYKRIIESLPKAYYSRFLLSANGGADLVYLDGHGKPVLMEDYRRNALAAVYDATVNLDIAYIGDDPSPNGNDYAAFQLLGPGRSVLVSGLGDTKSFLEKWLHERKIAAAQK